MRQGDKKHKGKGNHNKANASSTNTSVAASSSPDNVNASSIVKHKEADGVTGAGAVVNTTAVADWSLLNAPIESPFPGIVFSLFDNENTLKEIMDMIAKDLSEPYSIYTYRYFIFGWPELCIVARHQTESGTGKLAGVIICKADRENRRKRLRGYIAMLAVDKELRGKGIGSFLAEKAISKMQQMGCDEVVLETELINKSALSLYEKLGFFKDKRLRKYYLNGGDAYRLKLHFTEYSINGLTQ